MPLSFPSLRIDPLTGDPIPALPGAPSFGPAQPEPLPGAPVMSAGYDEWRGDPGYAPAPPYVEPEPDYTAPPSGSFHPATGIGYGPGSTNEEGSPAPQPSIVDWWSQSTSPPPWAVGATGGTHSQPVVNYGFDTPVFGGAKSLIANAADVAAGGEEGRASPLSALGMPMGGVLPEVITGTGLAAKAAKVALPVLGGEIANVGETAARAAGGVVKRSLEADATEGPQRGALNLGALFGQGAPHGITSQATPIGDNILGLKDIAPADSLSVADRITNAFAATVRRGPVKNELATPAMAERARVQPVIGSQAANLAAQAQDRIASSFVRDAEGRIPSLAGADPFFVDAAGNPMAPTVQDVAARLPQYHYALSSEQQATMGWLDTQLSRYRELEEQLGIPNLHTRQDVIEGKGFYLPRGRATEEGADLALSSRGSSRKAAVQPSMASGIANGERYPAIEDAIHSFVLDSGQRSADTHVANYFKGLEDVNAALLGSTPADRVDPQLRSTVETLRANISARLDTLTRQQARLSSQQIASERGAKLADRFQRVADKSAQRYEALTLDGSTDDLIKDAERSLNALQNRSVRAAERAGKTEGKAMGAATADRQAVRLEADVQAAIDRVKLRGNTLEAAGNEAVATATSQGQPVGPAVVEATGLKPGTLARQIQQAGRDIKLLNVHATRVANFTESTGRRMQSADALAKTADAAATAAEQAVKDAQATLRDLKAQNTPKPIIARAERESAQLDALAQQARVSSDMLGARLSETQGRIPLTQSQIAGYRNQLGAIKGQWEHAKQVAQNAPRGTSSIDLNPLRGYSFPDAVASAANAVLDAEGPARGRLSTAVKVTGAINNLSLGLRATGDLSATMIQGLLGLGADQRAYGKALNVSFRGIGSERALGAYLRDFDAQAAGQQLPLIQNWAQAGLHLGGSVTEFTPGTGLASLGHKIQGAPIIKQSNQAFGYFGDTLRLQWGQDLLKTELARGRSLAEIQASGDLERIADVVNKMSGWSPNRFGGDIGDALLFAPRFLQARLETLVKGSVGLARTPTQLFGGQVPLDQRVARESLLRTLGMMTAGTFAINAALGNETDTRFLVTDAKGDRYKNPNFMRIRYANIDWSLFGPYDSLAGAITEVALGHPEQAGRQLAGPVLSGGWDLISGRDFLGRPVRDTPEHFAVWLGSQFAPISSGNTGAIVSTAAKGDVAPADAGLAVGFSILGAKGSPLSFSDVRDMVTKEMAVANGWTRDGKPIARYEDLNKGQAEQVMAHPSVQKRLNEIPPADTGSEAQQAAYSFQRLDKEYGDLEQGLNRNLNAGMTGKPLKEAVQSFKQARLDKGQALLGDKAKPERKQLEDRLGERYWGVDRYEDAKTGEPDYERQTVERAQILNEAKQNGIDPAYITGSGKGTYRGMRFKDPQVRQAIEQYEADQETMRPYWEVRDTVLRQYPALKGALDDYAAEAAKARKSGDEAQATWLEQRAQSVADKYVTPAHREYLNGHRDAVQALDRWGYQHPRAG